MFNPVHQCRRFSRQILKRIKKLFGHTGEPPQDPYAYAGVRNKPRLPHLSATGVLDEPDE